MKSDQGERGGTREPGGARWQMVSGGTEGKRSQGGADLSTGQVGAVGTEAGFGTRESSGMGVTGGLKTLGRSLQHVGDAEELKDTSGSGIEGLAEEVFEEVGEGGWAGILERQGALESQEILEIQRDLE